MYAHDQNVLRQFDPQAAAYLASEVHAAGADLAHASALAAHYLPPGATALDVGCGAGHLGYALAPAVARITLADPSPGMLSVVRTAAARRGMGNIETVPARAEALPFAAASMDLVASRYTAHHWFDVPAALAEMRRVVKPDGHLLMIDLLGHDTPLVDTHLQAIELLRDPSHVRDYDRGQWRAMIREAGFTLAEEARWTVRLEFSSWVQRIRTSALNVEAIRSLQRGAPTEVRDALALEEDGSFSPVVGLFWARAAS